MTSVGLILSGFAIGVLLFIIPTLIVLKQNRKRERREEIRKIVLEVLHEERLVRAKRERDIKQAVINRNDS